MTNCDKEILGAYADGELAADARARVEAHVAACAPCRDALAEIRELSAALRDLPRATAPASVAKAVHACDAEAVSASVDGLNPPNVEKHCDDCRGRAEDWRDIAAAIRALPRVAAPPSILEAVRAKMNEAKVVPFRRRAWVGYSVAAAASLVFAVNILYFSGMFGSRKAAAPASEVAVVEHRDLTKNDPVTENESRLEPKGGLKDGAWDARDREQQKQGFLGQFADASKRVQGEEPAKTEAAPVAPAEYGRADLPPAARAPAAPQTLEPAPAVPPVVMLRLNLLASNARGDDQRRGVVTKSLEEMIQSGDTFVVESKDPSMNGALVVSAVMTEEECEKLQSACRAELGATLLSMDDVKLLDEKEKAQDAHAAEESMAKAPENARHRTADKNDADEGGVRNAREVLDELDRSLATQGYRLRQTNTDKANEMFRRGLENSYAGRARPAQDPRAADAPADSLKERKLAKGLTDEDAETRKKAASESTGLPAEGAAKAGGGAGVSDKKYLSGKDLAKDAGAKTPVAGATADSTGNPAPPAAKPVGGEKTKEASERSKRLVRVVVWLMNPPAPEPPAPTTATPPAPPAPPPAPTEPPK